MLRNACGDPYGMASYAAIESHDFDRLCDAIDAIHAGLERENAELRRQLDSLMYECRPMTDENMAEDGWIRLPLDADGVPIRVGDVMDSKVDYLFDGRPFEVRALVLCEDGWEAADSHFGNRYEPNSLRHHHGQAVEDVLTEFAERWHDAKRGERTFDYNALVAEYAKRLTLAEGDAE